MNTKDLRCGSVPVTATSGFREEVGGLIAWATANRATVFATLVEFTEPGLDLRIARGFREEELIATVRRDRPERHGRWIASKWRSTGRRR